MGLFKHSKTLVFILLILMFCFIACQDKEKASANPTQQTQQTQQITTIKEAPNSFYKYAYAMSDCAPWDGAAVRFFLVDKAVENADATKIARPYLSIAIYKNVSELSGKTFNIGLGQGVNIGTASLCPEQGNCPLIKSGIVIIKKVLADQSIEGEYQLEFEGNIKKIGSFHASWLKYTALCG